MAALLLSTTSFSKTCVRWFFTVFSLELVMMFHSFHHAANVGLIPGTGLGLTSVKRCVELHGGIITFAIAEGRGRTFTVRLPI